MLFRSTTITKQTAAELVAIMEQVVERGTARAAQIDGFTIAGKTGTAAQLVNGRYSTSLWNASFVGFVPSRRPEFTLIVVIDAPHTRGHTGGVAAAPVFKRISESVLRLRAVQRTINAPAPLLVKRALPGTPRTTEGPVVTAVKTPLGSGFPDLTGKSARDVVQILTSLGLDARIRGTGLVVRQEPAPGTPIDEGAVSTVWLERRIASTTP